MAFEHLLNDAALNAAPAPMNQTDLAQTSLGRRGDVLLDHRLDVTRLEGVKVQRVFDRDADRQGWLSA
jgi:hypothetical protein